MLSLYLFYYLIISLNALSSILQYDFNELNLLIWLFDIPSSTLNIFLFHYWALNYWLGFFLSLTLKAYWLLNMNFWLLARIWVYRSRSSLRMALILLSTDDVRVETFSNFLMSISWTGIYSTINCYFWKLDLHSISTVTLSFSLWSSFIITPDFILNIYQ